MKKNFSLTTYFKIILGSWPSIFKIISKYTKIKKQAIIKNLPFLSSEQLEEVFFDKQNTFIRYSITAHAHALSAMISLNDQLNKIEKQRNQTSSALIELEKYIKENPEDARLIKATEAANTCLNEIKNTQVALQKEMLHLEALNKKMDKLLEKQDAQWETFREEWSSKLIQAFEKIGIQLTTLEKTEIKRSKTLAEIIQRMMDLGLKLPKNLQKNIPKSIDYRE